MTYGNSQWGDLLTAYNGVAITYDGIGNPLSYYNGTSYTFTWEGRRLVGAVKGAKTMSFAYNDEGIRTSKTVNGVTTTYYVNGGRIVAESNNLRTMVYIYDASGAPIGMMYRTTSYAANTFDVFWYEKNLQGDIIGVCNSEGDTLISYNYSDAWGNYTVSYANDGGSTGAIHNPFKYRGYYYDADLGMYYLQSRYYDSKICRFISADGYVSTGQGILGNNMFAYCNNDPVNNVDPEGDNFWKNYFSLAVIVTTICEQIAYKNAEETYEKYKDVITIENGKVSNANQVNYKDIWALAAYVRYYTDSGAEGTSYGLAIEWVAHKAGDTLGMSGGQDLDFGKTIVSDFESHHSIDNIWQAIIMNAAELLTNPIFYIYDIARSF